MKNNSKSNQHKFIRQASAIAFIVQAVIIGVKGNLDVLSGKPILDVIPWMITQGIELIVKTHRTQKIVQESDRTPQNPNNRPND
ncbi:hypothetical protein [Microseira wollei]|uniref:Holin n=1 Tax=Microseira wollei NIES-4236 TaxID=2530354 RepID=A0AAV3X5W1_9CYAN|nr:hypothetical protein [Microseira wollei]GET38252.1 hypothetical protein MiSe_30070 [Microseira wollei NIES-4236]